MAHNESKLAVAHNESKLAVAHNESKLAVEHNVQRKIPCYSSAHRACFTCMVSSWSSEPVTEVYTFRESYLRVLAFAGKDRQIHKEHVQFWRRYCLLGGGGGGGEGGLEEERQ